MKYDSLEENQWNKGRRICENPVWTAVYSSVTKSLLRFFGITLLNSKIYPIYIAIEDSIDRNIHKWLKYYK